MAWRQPRWELRGIADLVSLHDVFNVRGEAVNLLVQYGVQADGGPGGNFLPGRYRGWCSRLFDFHDCRGLWLRVALCHYRSLRLWLRLRLRKRLRFIWREADMKRVTVMPCELHRNTPARESLCELTALRYLH